MVDGDGAPMRARWARLRFSIIGSLLANPPEKGDLQERIQELADKLWEHPVTGQKVQFGFSTVEKVTILPKSPRSVVLSFAEKFSLFAGSVLIILYRLRISCTEGCSPHNARTEILFSTTREPNRPISCELMILNPERSRNRKLSIPGWCWFSLAENR